MIRISIIITMVGIVLIIINAFILLQAGKGLMLRKMYLEGRRLSLGFKRQIKAKKMISSLQRLTKRVLFVLKFCCKNLVNLSFFMKLLNVVVEGEAATLASNLRHCVGI